LSPNGDVQLLARADEADFPESSSESDDDEDKENEDIGMELDEDGLPMPDSSPSAYVSKIPYYHFITEPLCGPIYVAATSAGTRIAYGFNSTVEYKMSPVNEAEETEAATNNGSDDVATL